MSVTTLSTHSVNTTFPMSCREGRGPALFISWHILEGGAGYPCACSSQVWSEEEASLLLSFLVIGEEELLVMLSYFLWKWSISVNVGWRQTSGTHMFSYNRSLQFLWAVCERLAHWLSFYLWSKASIIHVHHIPCSYLTIEVLPSHFVWQKEGWKFQTFFPIQTP